MPPKKKQPLSPPPALPAAGSDTSTAPTLAAEPAPQPKGWAVHHARYDGYLAEVPPGWEPFAFYNGWVLIRRPPVGGK